MTKTITRYRAQWSMLDGVDMIEDDKGDYVRYEDIEHLLVSEPNDGKP